MATRAAAVDAWREIARALAASGDKSDRDLAHAVAKYVGEMPAVTGADRAGVSRVLSGPVRQVDQEYQK
jgi:hypothetical protein